MRRVLKALVAGPVAPPSTKGPAVTSFEAVAAACEALAAAHGYDVTSDGCMICDLDYPCFTRLNAESVIVGLNNLINGSSPVDD